MPKIDPLILARKPREDMRHHGGTSWIGGAPALAGRPWPRGRDGRTLHFLAQLDLGLIAVMRPETPLPREGAILFFAGLHEGGPAADHAVLHVPLNRDFAMTPDDLPPLYGDDFASVFRFASSVETAPRCLPRWPVGLHSAPWDHAETMADAPDRPGDPRAATRREATALGARQVARLSVSDPVIRDALPRFDVLSGLGIHWNHSLHLYGDSLIQVLRSLPRRAGVMTRQIERGQLFQESLTNRRGLFRRRPGAEPVFAAEREKLRFVGSKRITDALQADLEEIGRLLPAFHTLVAEVAEWTDRRRAWDETSPEDRRRLVAVADRLENEFSAFGPFPYPRARLSELGNDTLRIMAHGPEDIWQRLPAPVRDHINRHERMPRIEAGWHQAFGHGQKIQGGVCDMAKDHILLLQLVADDFICLDPGDAGAISFWIRPEAAKAGRWQEARCLIAAS